MPTIKPIRPPFHAFRKYLIQKSAEQIDSNQSGSTVSVASLSASDRSNNLSIVCRVIRDGMILIYWFNSPWVLNGTR
jgi:hypothetical protein